VDDPNIRPARLSALFIHWESRGITSAFESTHSLFSMHGPIETRLMPFYVFGAYKKSL
jgi:hypothetical protein